MTDASSSSDALPTFRIEISPEPTADERDALVAVLSVVVSTPVVVPDDQSDRLPPSTEQSRWARAGREAAFASRDLRMRRSR